MKRLNSLMALLMVFALSFVACEQNQEPTPKPENKEFNVEVGEVTSSSIAYKVTPRDLEAEYICLLYDVKSAEEFTKDEYLVATILQELEIEARAEGMTLLEYMPEITDKGAIENGLFSNLAPETEYYILVFGVDAADEYKVNTELSKTKVTTAAAPVLDMTFDIKTTVDGNTAKYLVTPSDLEATWYFYTIPQATFDHYTDPEGDYRMSPQRFLLYCLEMQINALRKANYTDEQIMKSIFFKGELELQGTGLNANTNYINMVAGFIVTEEGQITIATEPTTSTYKTGGAKAVELTFNITVTDIEAMRAAIKIVPSDNTLSFCWMCGQWDGKQTAEEIMNQIVGQWGGWMNNGSMLYKGIQDYTGGPGSAFKYSLEAPDTDYYVIAFGYAGGITSKPEMVTFRTLPAPPAEDTTFTLTASEVTPYGCKLSLKASEQTTYFIVNACLPEEYNEELIVKELDEGFDAMYEAMKEFDPYTPIASVLKSSYYKGDQNIELLGIAPETTLMGYIMAISTETGHVAKVHTFENLVTTKAVGSVTPAIELVGHYSGNDENGAVFGDAAATKGKAITVVKYNNLDGARSLFTSIFSDDLTNVNVYSDPQLWKDANYYWKKCSTSEPYSFYLVDWDADQTALAYTTDNTGTPGAIARLYTRATVENKANIQELIDLVAELNAEEASKAFSMPKSLVINNGYSINIESVNLPVAEAQVDTKMECATSSINPFECVNIRPFNM